MSGLFSKVWGGSKSSSNSSNSRSSRDSSVLAVRNLGNAVIACGADHTAAITSDGQVVCWGYNGWGQCAVSASLERAVSISCGNDLTAALTPEGKGGMLGFCSQWTECRSR
jgi:alpha-tubulin suppressor-like RCC1 family protein